MLSKHLLVLTGALLFPETSQATRSIIIVSFIYLCVLENVLAYLLFTSYNYCALCNYQLNDCE